MFVSMLMCFYVREGGAGNNGNVNLTPGILVSPATANPGPHYGSVMYQVIPFITNTVYTLTTSSIKFNTEPLSSFLTAPPGSEADM